MRLSRNVLAGAMLAGVVAVAAVAWVALDPGFRDGRSSASDSSNAQDDDAAFGRRVRAYLMRHPEVIFEAVRKYRERQAAERNSAAKQIIASRTADLLRDPMSPVGGNAKGDVTLVEFFDYNCPYCRRMGPIMETLEAADSNLRIVYKEFPILGASSRFAARAALASQKQGKYIAFHKALMSAKGVANEKSVMELARKVGLDIERLRRDMKDPAIDAQIEKNIKLAVELRINGTPGFVVGNEIVRGATSEEHLKRLIGEARKRK